MYLSSLFFDENGYQNQIPSGIPEKKFYAFQGWKDNNNNVYQPGDILTDYKIGELHSTWLKLGQNVYISPQGDLYAREFLTHTENKIMITPEGDIYASEYIEDTSFKMLNGKLHAKSFNIGVPNEYQ